LHEQLDSIEPKREKTSANSSTVSFARLFCLSARPPPESYQQIRLKPEDVSQIPQKEVCMPAKKLRPVIVCTEHRGVFFGFTSASVGADPIALKGARMAIRWGTTRGVMELAETGPTRDSNISAKADIEVRKITSVFEVAPAALTAWEALK
jgi:hypothetical protein